MSTAELEQRVTAVEQAIETLRGELGRAQAPTRPWWREDAGRFANDDAFAEIDRLGRDYRRSVGPPGEEGRNDRP